MGEYSYFGFHKLNAVGMEKAKKIQAAFEALQKELAPVLAHPRASALVMTNLEQACFYAKKSMALDSANQEVTNG